MPDLELKHSGGGATLLQDWTEATHLAVLMDLSHEEIDEVKAGLPMAKTVMVHVRDLDEEGLRALGTGKKLLIVRPDGYVGFRGIVEPHMPWTEYAEQDGLVPSMKMAFSGEQRALARLALPVAKVNLCAHWLEQSRVWMDSRR